MIVRNIIGALTIGSIYALLALGYSLIYQASGLMTFVQGELFMLGAFVGLTLYAYLKIPFIITLVLTMVLMFFIGVLIEKYVIKMLLKKKAAVIYVVLSTIALSIILQNFAMLVWGSGLIYFPSIFNVDNIKIGSVSIIPESLLGIGTALVAMLLLHVFITKSKFGTAMRAAAQDPLAAGTMGINVSQTTSVTWGISAALAGVAGVIYSPIYAVSMVMGASPGLKAFAGAVIGGYGNMYGAIVGSLFLGLAETFVAGFISSSYKDFISFFILILILVAKPRGIFNADVLGD